jgi:reactive intermediate/imine deaminase
MIPHYSPYKKADGWLYTSGQLPLIDGKTKQCPDGISAQTLLVLQKVEALLAQEGLSKGDIIKTTAYITDIDYWAEVNAVYADFFGAHKPARSIIPVSKLHYGCLIELEAIAYKAQ